ncbi:MAG: nitroreductase family protein [Deltaproteobacteria bacterium]|nr:nitroreductase family protein [Deltaproteobacteria bacterium]
MDALKAIEARKSTRSYTKEPLADDRIQTLVKAATRAPKAGDFHIAVVTNPDALQECNDIALECMKKSGNDFLVSRASLPGYQPLYGAPLLLVFSGSEQNPYSLANASCAATAATIAATALELGSCYVVTPTMALAAKPALARKMGVPEGFKPQCCVIAGYSAGDAYGSPASEFTNISYCR